MRGSVSLARRARVPPVFVALGVVGLGTSLPELMVSVRAAMEGFPGLALGNVVGSNIANVLLVAGTAAIVFPLRTRDQGARRSTAFMAAVTLLVVGICLWGRDVTRLDGGLMLGVLVVAAAVTLRAARRAQLRADAAVPLDWVLGLPNKVPTIVFFIGLGLVVLPLGADLLVDASVEIATRLGVPNTVVGLSVVAFGTSLPEVATTIVAGLHRNTGMVVGTIAGSNIFNLLGILGTAALVSAEPIPVSGSFVALDLPVMVGASLVLAAFAALRRPLQRSAGIVFAVAYVVYLGVLYVAA